MRKFLRIIGIAVAIAAVFVLASCSFIQRNDDRYNNQVAIKVGDEEITLKRLWNSLIPMRLIISTPDMTFR